MANLPRRLRELRLAANLTQFELADRSLVGRRTIARIERGYDRASRATIKLLADALGTTVEELLANGDEDAAA